MNQRLYGVLPLNYGAKSQVAPVGLEPTCTPNRQLGSVVQLLLCCPLHHRDIRADDWTCTSMNRFTKPVPSYSATSA